jgi:PadR family transcriptional regulator, regulatory protein PadR
VPGATPRSIGSSAGQTADSRDSSQPLLQRTHTSWNTIARVSAAPTYVVPLNTRTGSRISRASRIRLDTTCCRLREPVEPQKTQGVSDLVIAGVYSPLLKSASPFRRPGRSHRSAPTRRAVSAFLFDLGKVTSVAIIRMTKATRDLLSVLLDAHCDDSPIYGWEIKKRTRRSGPTVYGVLDRLEDDGLVVGEWEQQAEDSAGPRRRFYTLTSDGVGLAMAVLGRLAVEPPSEPPASRPVLRGVV